MISPGAGCDVWFSNPTGSFISPKGIQHPSPLQRQWISFDRIGSSSWIAAHVSGASGSQRAVKFKSPTRIDRSVMARSVAKRAMLRRVQVSEEPEQPDGRPADDFDPRPR